MLDVFVVLLQTCVRMWHTYYCDIHITHTHTYTRIHTVGADWSTPFKVTLAYTDPPATPGADNTLVNDLDLVVQVSTLVTRYDVNCK